MGEAGRSKAGGLGLICGHFPLGLGQPSVSVTWQEEGCVLKMFNRQAGRAGLIQGVEFCWIRGLG